MSAGSGSRAASIAGIGWVTQEGHSDSSSKLSQAQVLHTQCLWQKKQDIATTKPLTKVSSRVLKL